VVLGSQLDHSTPSAGKPRTWGRILGITTVRGETLMRTTESQITTETKLKRIAYLSASDRQRCFTGLIHHFNEESLKECFNQLDGKKAIGIDGISKEQYRNNLDENIKELLARMKRMAYRPGPIRQAIIPKEGKPGETRPLGISNLEDKIIQKMTKRILDSIYEPLFLNCSYGFRDGIGCHDAIRDLTNHLFKNDVQVVIDVDLENYFGSIDHKILEQILREKIKDEKLMRYIIRMFKSGLLKQGELEISEEGVVQGSICSPTMANILAHYVIDEWIENMVKPRCAGTVRLFRYCDDLVICCQLPTDAQRIKEALVKRLDKYQLKLNEEKTKMVNFSKQADNQASFDFLGFSFYLGRSKQGAITPKLKTSGKRVRTKLKRVNEWARSVRSRLSLRQIWKLFGLKLRGHINYYGVSHNASHVQKFIHHAVKILFKWLNRRSQKKSFTWESFSKFRLRFPLPKVKIYHKLF
jgi:RNA-directed DNA polymerase